VLFDVILVSDVLLPEYAIDHEYTSVTVSFAEHADALPNACMLNESMAFTVTDVEPMMEAVGR
jgi:hypothetical protein